MGGSERHIGETGGVVKGDTAVPVGKGNYVLQRERGALHLLLTLSNTYIFEQSPIYSIWVLYLAVVIRCARAVSSNDPLIKKRVRKGVSYSSHPRR